MTQLRRGRYILLLLLDRPPSPQILVPLTPDPRPVSVFDVERTFDVTPEMSRDFEPELRDRVDRFRLER